MGVWLLRTRTQTKQVLLDMANDNRLKREFLKASLSLSPSHVIHDYQNFVGMCDQQPASFYENWTPSSSPRPDAISSLIQPFVPQTFRDKLLVTTRTLLRRVVNVLLVMKEGQPLTLRRGVSCSTAGATCDEVI